MCGGGKGMLGGSPPGPGGPMFGGGKGMFGGMLGAVRISYESITFSHTYALHGPRTAAGVDHPAFLALAAYHLAFLNRVSIAPSQGVPQQVPGGGKPGGGKAIPPGGGPKPPIGFAFIGFAWPSAL
jgi:hypothetical protein